MADGKSRLVFIGKTKATEEQKEQAVVLLSKIKGTFVPTKPNKKPILLDVKEDENIIVQWINILAGRNK